MRTRVLGWLVAVGVIAAGNAAWAQSPAGESAQQNVRESEQYERLLCTNAAFRAKRIAQECGPLEGSQFHDRCVASFQCDAGRRAPHWRKAPPSETIR
jgi:transposase